MIGQRDGVAQRPQTAAQQRDVDDGRFAGALPLEQCRRDPAGQVGARDGVTVGRSGRGDHSRHAGGRDRRSGSRPAPEGGHVVATLFRFGAPGAERAPSGVDDLRIDRTNVVDIDAELLPVSGKEAREEHIRAAGQLVEHFLALRHRYVQPDAALAAVGVLDVGVGIALDAQHPGLAEPTLRVTGHRVLDLDHLGAPLGQHGARRRDEPVHGDFQDADAFQRPHASAPSAGPATTAKVLRSKNSSNPATPISRPTPDCLKPPNGLSAPK